MVTVGRPNLKIENSVSKFYLIKLLVENNNGLDLNQIASSLQKAKSTTHKHLEDMLKENVIVKKELNYFLNEKWLDKFFLQEPLIKQNILILNYKSNLVNIFSANLKEPNLLKLRNNIKLGLTSINFFRICLNE
jgi:hypothetical protein